MCRYCNIGDTDEYMSESELIVTDHLCKNKEATAIVMEDYDYNKFINVCVTFDQFQIPMCGREL